MDAHAAAVPKVVALLLIITCPAQHTHVGVHVHERKSVDAHAAADPKVVALLLIITCPAHATQVSEALDVAKFPNPRFVLAAVAVIAPVPPWAIVTAVEVSKIVYTVL